MEPERQRLAVDEIRWFLQILSTATEKSPVDVMVRRIVCTVALPPSTILVFNEHRGKQTLERIMLGTTLKDDDLVFGHPNGTPIRPNTITRAWPILAVRAGLKAIRFDDAFNTRYNKRENQVAEKFG